MSSEQKKIILPPDMFSDLASHHLTPNARHYTRVFMSVPVVIEFKGEGFFKVDLVSISCKGMRIKQKISIKHASQCIVTFPTEPPIRLLSVPFIGVSEFNESFWDRIKFITEVHLDKVVRAIEKLL